MQDYLPAIILLEPQMGENIGATARAMHNFGLRDLRIVSPRDGWPNEMALEVARNAVEIVENAKIYESLQDAAKDIKLLYATTARIRDLVKDVVTPKECALHICQYMKQAKSAIMFGPERSGMNNDDIVLADKIVTIPVSPDNPSLNLAQAVVIVCYEIFANSEVTNIYDNVSGEMDIAPKEEITLLLEHLVAKLDDSGFLRQKQMRYKMVQNISNIFTRANLTSQEVRTMRGVVRSLSGD